jgi:hypothetical protein
MAEPTPQVYVEPESDDSYANGMSYYAGFLRYTFNEATNDWDTVEIPDQT